MLLKINEHTLTRGLLDYLVSHLPSSWVVRKHADYATAGDPDVSITGNGKTTWWEIKHAKPRVKWQNELQRVKCVKLANAGYCRLIVFRESTLDTDTCIVHPTNCAYNGVFQPERSFPEVNNYPAVCDFIREVHRA